MKLNPLEFRQDVCGLATSEKIVIGLYVYTVLMKCMSATNGRTDRHTDGHSLRHNTFSLPYAVRTV